MGIENLTPAEGSTANRKRVGRGVGSGTAKTSGHGQKGQKSRTGVAINGFEGGQMPIYMRLPKRGFNNPNAKKFAEINLGRLQEALDAKKLDAKVEITAQVLKDAGVLSKTLLGLFCFQL